MPNDSWEAIDRNTRGSLTAVSSVDNKTIVRLVADPVTGRLLVDSASVFTKALIFETPVGAIDDSNTIFTVSNTPTFIDVNGAIYVVGTGTYVSFVGGTITLSSAVGVDGFIRSFYAPTSSGVVQGTWYTVSGAVNGINVTFTIPVAVTSDFQLFLARQPQMLTTDFTCVVGGGVTTITMTYAPDISLSGQPFKAFVIS